ncbi:hypothetical protein ACIA49_38530 [Kribbella sp. NPDC051587]|uniref:hypothetical protein n=1 Tax=Kribbella sp. NPDC051587 TaxID=3364119 RepID=UPI0037917D43
MRKLALLVAKRAAIRVEADYSTEGRSTKWYLQWDNGPSKALMLRHAKAAAKAVDGLDVAEVGFRRYCSERHVVAAWLLRSPDLDTGHARILWASETYVDKISFPDDLADDDPLWELVDYAFDLCGGPSTSADTVLTHVARIKLRGLRMEHWLDQIDSADPATASQHLGPLLSAAGLSERTRENLRSVTADIMHDLSGNGPRQADPRVRVLAAEAARAALTQPLDDEQRRLAIESVAAGTALYKLSRWIGKSDSTLLKRWNTAEFNEDLAPVAWVRQHHTKWAQAFLAAIAELEANHDLVRHNRDIRQMVNMAKAVLGREDANWQSFLGSPETARTLIAAAELDLAEQQRDRKKYRLVDETDDSGLQMGPALQRLAELLAEYDAARPPQRRGGAHPRQSPQPRGDEQGQDNDCPQSCATDER